MKIFIIGGTGFIGRNLAKRLLDKGHEVICGGRSFDKIKPLLKSVKTASVDIEDKNTILDVLRRERPDVVYHCAALVTSHSLKKLRRFNVAGTRNVLDACFIEGVERVIYLSSVAVISANHDIPLTDDLPLKATHAYGQSKLEAEEIALEYRKKGLKIAILRPAIVYGEDEPHALSYLAKAIKMRILPVFGKGDNKLHLVSVENLVDVMVLCLTKEEAYEGTYLVADKEVLSVKELLNFTAEILGAKPPINIPKGFAMVLIPFPFVGKDVSYYLKDRIYSIKRLEEKLGYTPRISVYEGLKKAVLQYSKMKSHQVTK